MNTQELQFAGKTYRCRIVKSIDGEKLLIAPTTLLDALQPGSFNDRNEGFKNKEAKKLYNKIFYFTDEKTLQRSDNGLIAELRESNPDWFE